MSNNDHIRSILKHSQGVQPSDRTNIKLGALIRIVSILNSLTEPVITNNNQSEAERLNTIIQEQQKEHRRLISIIRSQDKEILRLATIIKNYETMR